MKDIASKSAHLKYAKRYAKKTDTIKPDRTLNIKRLPRNK